MRLIVGLFVVVSSLSLNAAPADYFSAVLADENVKALVTDDAELISIENSLTFRCPGCHEFTLRMRKTANGAEAVEYNKIVNTSLDMKTFEIKVSVPAPPAAR